MIRRQIRENARQPGKHPTVTAPPENLAALGVALRDKPAVAVVQVLTAIVQIVGRSPEFAVRMGQVTLISRGLCGSNPRRRRHENGITPAPTVLAVARAAER